MRKFMKRPVVISAVQFTGNVEAFRAACEVWSKALAPDLPGARVALPFFVVSTVCVEIETPEGTMNASPGDWIIRGVAGEYYPCKPDIFAATYDEVIA